MIQSDQVRICSKGELQIFINNIIKENTYDVIGVIAKGNRFVYAPLDNASDLRLDHDVTILPPKKYFLPQYETLITFDLKKQFDMKRVESEKPLAIIGIHPYDIIALEQTDKLYNDSQKDDYYFKRRNNAIIIAADIQKLHDRSFAVDMNTHITQSGFDLLLTKLDGNYAITIGTEKGERFLDTYATTKSATEKDIKKIEKVRNKVFSQYEKKLKIDKKEWPSYLENNYKHPIWKNRSEKCMECASCTMVCPTCYCYDVKDEITLDLKDGTRNRTWDSCLIKNFTEVAGGEVFRDNIVKRYRHRFYRKGSYLPARYDFIACVGCGRCGIACLPDIADPCHIFNKLSHFEKSPTSGNFFIKRKDNNSDDGVIHVPRMATIKKMMKCTENEMFFKIELDDKKPLGHIPGQFIEISVFGFGEAPISVSSGPSESTSFEIVVRSTGSVTNKLCSMNEGDKIGIRGPFGNGFDMKKFEGKNLLLSAGGIGIVPMRSLIQYVMDKKNRKKYREVTILYGAKQPREILFKDEIEKWCHDENVNCELTVDQCQESDCWYGCTGLITTLYPTLQIDKYDSVNTIAVVIGPPVMYNYVIKCLQTLGISDENIYLSLERRMKCGVGKCGHCQINGVYVCKEGPVFNFTELKTLPEALE